MSRWPHERYHAEPVYDVHDCGTGQHDRYISGWGVVNSEGIYEAGPFDSEPEAAEEAQRLNSAAKAEQETMAAGNQQHNVRAKPTSAAQEK